jgi:hypothetical protein
MADEQKEIGFGHGPGLLPKSAPLRCMPRAAQNIAHIAFSTVGIQRVVN